MIEAYPNKPGKSNTFPPRSGKHSALPAGGSCETLENYKLHPHKSEKPPTAQSA
jgi:hypothetical protein